MNEKTKMHVQTYTLSVLYMYTKVASKYVKSLCAHRVCVCIVLCDPSTNKHFFLFYL